ncbi:MAG: DNA replication/repair protein RecF [Bdellovibrionota bacterium]
MYVEKLKLYNFRNFEDFSATFSNNVNFIIGDNAQGKTNLIEAINVISTTKSFRTSQIKDLITWNKHEMSVFLTLHGNLVDQDLCFSVSKKGRQAYVNGEKCAATDFISRLCCVAFSPTDLTLIKGSPEERRKFIDRHIVDIWGYLIKDMLEYNRALKSKNAILKTPHPTPAMISVWNEIMARTAVNIINARRTFLLRLEKNANLVHALFGANDGRLSLRLKTNFGSDDKEVTQEEILKKLNDNISRELALQTSLIGPHRDDVIIKLNEHDAKAFASQGQTRSVVLSLKLGVIALLESERKDPPVLLLDDVDSELDEKRREAFFDFILSSPRQVFITGTDAEIVKRCRNAQCQTMYFKNGKLITDSCLK